MPDVEARIKIKGKHYEIMVDLDEALKIKNGKGDIMNAYRGQGVFHDVKRATQAPKEDLMEAFGTTDFYQIAKKIILSGEVQKTQDFREEEREKKIKQVINMILRNATDQHGRPYTEERIKTALKEIHYNFDNHPIERQMQDLVEKLKTIIPIKIETKKIRLTIPARFTGQIYGLLQENKESEDWLANGDLQVVLNIPAGLIIEFYDKINSITHGAARSEEIK